MQSIGLGKKDNVLSWNLKDSPFGSDIIVCLLRSWKLHFWESNFVYHNWSKVIKMAF